MTKYFLAAEADQIQDLIFRSSRLREVVGGSQLLAKFCEQGAKELLAQSGGLEEQLVVNNGGAFRIWFADRAEKSGLQQAGEFGRNLAELYRRSTGGTLTVAEPVEYKTDFRATNNEVRKALRAAKSRGQIAAATAVHLPYLAFCASCGMALAAEHAKRHDEDEDERANYVCQDCLHKSVEARPTKSRREAGEAFVDLFRAAVWRQLEGESYPPQNNQLRLAKKGDWLEAIEKFDPRRYVAYLKADGNGMGVWFNRCADEKQLRSLSQALTRVLRESLAAPCGRLLNRIAELEKLRADDKQVLPVLPLILGGDDLLALLPASWALHFAAEFCRAYETKIRLALQSDEIGLLSKDPAEAEKKTPTIAAAVVICKVNYPYTLAHERCEQLLDEAKKCARRLELERCDLASTINFAVITGNEVGSMVTESEGDYRPSLRPYLVRDNVALSAGLSVEKLLEHRRHLNLLPGKRRAEVERLYDVSELRDLPQRQSEAEWWQQFQAIIRRLSSAEAQKVEKALQDLGDANKAQSGYWRRVSRPSQEEFKGHGLPDLLAVWDYAWSLNWARSDYPE